MLRIESPQNNQIKEIASLSLKKSRIITGRFIAEGIKLVKEAIESPDITVHRVVVQNDLLEDKRISEIVSSCDMNKILLLATSKQIIEKISRLENGQGILAEISKKKKPSLDDIDFKGISILAHEIRDPRNIGLLMRTADAAGARNFISSKGAADSFNPIAVQASMGAVYHLNTVGSVKSEDVIDAARRKGAKVVGTLSREGTDVYEWADSGCKDFLLVLGNEGEGIDENILSKMDELVSIPIFGGSESLNVAVSGGVIMYLKRHYEMSHQKGIGERDGRRTKKVK